MAQHKLTDAERIRGWKKALKNKACKGAARKGAEKALRALERKQK